MKKSIFIFLLAVSFFAGCEGRVQPLQELEEIAEIGNPHLNASLIYKTYFRRAFIFQNGVL
ncbi:hypothetical protein [Helicobacter sp. MIT 05-5294]|uniref:hypothetical protein n=1 Tax=Helicobacter sp. MIT 05-5294 TaxID=1548150 RepID=UPI00051FA71E|nr:hypothetical protein [Helicobacter sp. MIT 05-5294]TLD89227.1 hypothetical protein LS69_000950 [Helicobacter sp. MIT 05-5294]